MPVVSPFRAPRARWFLAWLLGVTAALVSAAAYVSAVHAPRAWEGVRRDVASQLAVAAAHRASLLTAAVNDAFGDAETVADYPSVHLVLQGALPAADGPHLQDILTQFAARQQYLHLEIVDLAGHVVSRARGAQTTAAQLATAAEAVRTRGRVAVPGPPGTVSHIHYATTVVVDGKVIGAVVLGDASSRIVLELEPQGGPPGQIEFALVETATPGALEPLLVSSPVAVPSSLASLASGGATGEARNAGGEAVFAVAHAIPDTGWRFVGATRTAEVRATFDAAMRTLGLTWAALAVAVVTATFLLAWGSRRAADARFAKQQARLTMLLDRANDTILVVDLSGIVRDCNDRALEFYGLRRSALIGRHVVHDLRAVATRESGQLQFQTVLEAGHLVFETMHLRSDGREVPVEVSADLVAYEGGTHVVSVVRDITERKEAAARIERLNRMLRTVSEVSQMIVREADGGRLLSEACRIAVDEGAFRFAWIGRKDPDMVITPVASHGAPGVGPRIEARWDDTPFGRGAAGLAIREDRTVAIADVLADPRMAPWHERLAEAGVQAVATTPIRKKADVFGVLAVYTTEIGPFGDDALRLLEELATDLGFALQALDDRDARQANEVALAEQRHLFQRITELSPVIKYLFDLQDQRIVYTNRAFTDVLGHAPDEVSAMGSGVLGALLHPDDAARLETRTARFATARDGDLIESDYRMRHEDGTWRWLHGREVIFTRTADGRPKLLLGVAEDVTSRTRAEEALRQSEAQLRAVFDTAAIGIVLADRAGRLLRANHAVERILGYTLEELNARTFAGITHPDDSEIEPPLFRELLEGRRDTYTIEKRNIRKDGTTIWTAVSATAVRDAGERPLYLVGLVQDVTDRRMLQEQLLQSQKMESIGRLAGGVAHDFNNLLTAIMGYTEMLRQDLPPDHPGQAFVDEVSKAGARATALTRQLLAFARRQVIEPRLMDLNVVVADAEKMLRRLVGEDIVIVTSGSPDLGAVEADPGQMHQILVNLAVNARDAMPRGGTLIIETSNAYIDEQAARTQVDVRPGPYVSLAISDTGAGMSREVQAHLFEPFFTTKELGKGTGLGLATCHGIVKQAGGHIAVSSEPGHGTTFRVYLPRVERRADEGIAVAPLPPLRGGRETVVIAEDEGAVRGLASLTLRAHGYEVIEAATGAEALAVAGRGDQRIDLLVSDVVMPGLNGRDLAERFRILRPSARVLFISGHPEATIAHQGVLERGVEFLPKPFTPDRLARRVREILDRHV